MNKIIIVVLVILVIAVAIYFGQGLLSSAVSGQVDAEVARMVEQENGKLPKQIEQGIELERIRHDVDNRKLIFVYNFTEEIPEDRYGQIENETNSRVNSNADLVRVLSYGYQVVHQYSNQTGSVVLQFETTN